MNKIKTRPSVRILTSVLALITLLCAFPAFPVGASYKKAQYDDIKNETTESLRQQLEGLNSLIRENTEALEKAKSLQGTYDEKKEIYLTMEKLYENTLTTLDAERLLLEADIEKTRKEVVETKARYDETYHNFLELMRMSYEQSNANYIEILLGAESLTDFLSRIERVGSIMKYNDRIMDRLTKEKEELGVKYSELNAQLEEQEKNIADIEYKQEEVLRWQEENQAELDAIAKEISELIEKSDTLCDEQDVIDAEFQKMVTELEAAENKKRAEAAEKARQEAIAAAERKRLAEEEARKKAVEEAAKAQSFIWPVPSSFNHVTSAYGMRLHPVYGKYQMHYGIDIAASSGANIYASKAGTVSISKYHATYGYYIVLNHQDGTSTLYAHCSKLIAKVNETVKQGQVIAKVGMTGTATGNHLHFEVRAGGSTVDPLKDVKIIKPAGLRVS